MDKSLKFIVEQIITINHAWKHASERWGEMSNFANALKNQKSCLQARILREFPAETYLREDNENIDGEPLYSVRLTKSVFLRNGAARDDAEHMPVRVAFELFNENELRERVKKL